MAPPPPGSGFDPTLLSRIEDAGLNASVPSQQRWLDGWLLRLSPGKAKRARCVNAVSTGRRTVSDKLNAASTAFEQAGLPLIIRITPFTQPPGLDQQLADLGFESFDDTRVMVLDRLPQFPPDGRTPMVIQPLALEPFAQRVGTFRGSPIEQRQAHAARLLSSPVPLHAFEARIDGRPVACGQFALEDDLVGLYDVFTVESSRGQGVASALCRRLLSEAHDRGAKVAYLQVESDNHPARAVYHRLGFTDAYAYHYRSRASSLT